MAERRFTRKQALVAGGVGAAALGGGAAAVVIATRDDEGEDYPRLAVAKVGDLQPNKPVDFEYPLEGQRSVLVDLDEEVPGGVGDDVVATGVQGLIYGYRENLAPGEKVA